MDPPPSPPPKPGRNGRNPSRPGQGYYSILALFPPGLGWPGPDGGGEGKGTWSIVGQPQPLLFYPVV